MRSLREHPAEISRGALRLPGFGLSASTPGFHPPRLPSRLTSRSSRRRVVVSLKLPGMRAILATIRRVRRGLTPALGLMREITTAAAKCANCCQSFSHPSLGDYSYGQAVLSTTDGKHFATVDAFAEFPQRAAALAGQGDIWPVLASLADPIAGQSLSASIHCAHCGSSRLEFWGGNKSGTVHVPAATFSAASSLSKDLLTARIAAMKHGHKA
jgi:hypothetical protein